MLDNRNAMFSTFASLTIGTTTPITIVTPKNVVRQIIWGKVFYDCDSTVATRAINIYVYDPAGQLVGCLDYMSLTSNQTGEHFLQHADAEGVTNTIIQPELILPPDFYLSIEVGAGVAGDALDVHLVFADYQLTSKDDRSSSRRRT